MDDDLADSIDELKNEIKKISEKQDRLFKVIGKRAKIVSIVIPVILAISILVFFNPYYFVPTKEIEYGLKSNYEIEDLQAEKIYMWVSWKITQGDVFHINVQSSPEVTDERLNVIKDVIFNNDTVTIGDQPITKDGVGH